MSFRSGNGCGCFGRSLPATSQRFNQLDAGGQLFQLEVKRSLLVGEQGDLGRNHIEITIKTGLVAVYRKRQVILR